MLRFIVLLLIFTMASCNRHPGTTIENAPQESLREEPVAQKIVGGGCDGCELMYVDMPRHITAVDTSAGWHEKGKKLLISGTVFKKDGKTPASDVVIYYWQTDNNGYYSSSPGLDKQAERHGHIRGWLRTGTDGKYALYTIHPARYPNDTMPAHIHLSIKEPNIPNEYYVDEFVFDDDPLLTAEKKKALENRGGSGILKIVDKDGLQVAEHDIILGKNIPGYPR